MLGGKVYVGFALAEQLDRIAVFVFTMLINTVTFRANSVMFKYQPKGAFSPPYSGNLRRTVISAAVWVYEIS